MFGGGVGVCAMDGAGASSTAAKILAVTHSDEFMAIASQGSCRYLSKALATVPAAQSSANPVEWYGTAQPAPSVLHTRHCLETQPHVSIEVPPATAEVGGGQQRTAHIAEDQREAAHANPSAYLPASMTFSTVQSEVRIAATLPGTSQET